LFVRKPRAPYYIEDRSGTTVAVAVLVRIDRPMHHIDIQKIARDLDAAVVSSVGADENTAIGVVVRVSDRGGKKITGNLVLDAAVACPAEFERSQNARPRRSVIRCSKSKGPS
jgi:hypothetical protein